MLSFPFERYILTFVLLIIKLRFIKILCIKKYNIKDRNILAHSDIYISEISLKSCIKYCLINLSSMLVKKGY